MSQDSAINTALLHMCARAQGGPEGGSSSSTGAATAAAATTTTTTTSSSGPVAPGRQAGDYQWLKEALASVESPERKVKRLLDTMEKDGIVEDDMLEALEELSDLVEDLNWAMEFGLMNGPARVLALLSNTPSTAAGALAQSSSEVRTQLAMVIAHSAQLNEAVQDLYMKQHWEAVLIPALTSEDNGAALAAVLHACSCLCRDCPPNTLVFISKGGMEALTDILRRSERNVSRVTPKVLARTFFFMGCLASAGVTTEEAVILLCEHVETRELTEAAEYAAATTLHELMAKSATVVKEKVRAHMPKALKAWKALHVSEADADSRYELVKALDQVG